MSTETDFLDAFSAAAHDRELEDADYDIYHFFDSDFVGRLVFGYRDELNYALILEATSRDGWTEAGRRLLMSALMSRGINTPPNARMLPPHLFELRQQAERLEPDDNPGRRDSATEALGIAPILKDLAKEAKSDDSDRLLSALLEQGPQVFYGIELLSGSWRTRLGHALRLGLANGSPFDDMGSMTRGATMASIVELMVGSKHRGEASLPTRFVRDALALATLVSAISSSEGVKPPFPIVRFYTETPRIRNAWESSSRFRQMLSYKPVGASGRKLYSSSHSVFRNTYYYLIRSLIPQLGYSYAPISGSDEGGDLIFQICEDLARATQELQSGGIGESDLITFPVGGQTLGEYMAQLTDLSSYSQAWNHIADSFPKVLSKSLADDLLEIVSAEKRNVGAIERSYQRHIQVLSDQTNGIRVFSDTYLRIHTALNENIGTLRPTYGEYFAHFGLMRWGFSPQPQCEEVLRKLVDTYEPETEGDTSEQTRGALRSTLTIDLANRLMQMFAPAPAEMADMYEHVAVLAFMSLIRDYDTVVQNGDRLLAGIKSQLSPSAEYLESAGALENMISAARIRQVIQENLRLASQARDPAGLSERAIKISSQVSKEHRTFPSNPQAIALTQGYVLFHAWSALNTAAIALGLGGHTRRARYSELAEQSFEIVLAVLHYSEPDLPLYPLLLNHCVYVGSFARVWSRRDLDDRLSQLLRELLGYGARPESPWTYRFDDTISFYYYTRAAYQLETLLVAGDVDPDVVKACASSVEESKRWLRRLPAEVRDDELIAHRALVHEIDLELSRRFTPLR